MISIATALSFAHNGMYSLCAVPWIYAVYSFAGAHMVLNLRIAGDNGAATEHFILSSLEARRGPGEKSGGEASTTIDASSTGFTGTTGTRFTYAY
ncbi:hypothetical protein CC1G_15666 [Coprinopsis cinerea okayama7|uniref:Uncharacterized protein n=1 Tax=Coprinopsis cinerea (strain Okayama-7 / 130 / ATCC MYA-4618 / FGSC 9003) TaxID=240176 RepID=D6RQC6_COPC7|nr:hypothetical protein CC1G_15666 [Coprinopsis cinerea okayama7\|eukprot:XP_002910236.1 hypothetical protein CC1G_15666 [Coprinopsis cinerea okayama7\